MTHQDLNPAHPMPKPLPLPSNYNSSWWLSLSRVVSLPCFWWSALPLTGFTSGCSRQSFYLEFPSNSSPSFWAIIMVLNWAVCDFTPQTESEKPGDIFGCENWAGGFLLASRGERPGLLLNILQGTRHTLTTKNFPAPNVSSTEDE